MKGDDDPLRTRSLDYRAAADAPTADPDGDVALAATATSGEAATSDPDVGNRIDRYRIERRLGAGGMGVVYLAHDPDLDRPVAIKVLRPELRAGRARLLREGQAIARLTHVNVITVFDVGSHGDDLFIAMEYVDGVTLGQWLGQRLGKSAASEHRPWRDVLDRFLAAGRGLAAAHARGLVHRDFKPDNVLLGDDGRVVVSDFGLARVGDGEPVGKLAPRGDDVFLTRTGNVLGTPAYMAPEQFRGGTVDARSDQFSFCVALWLGLYGRRPFDPPDGPSLSFDDLSKAVLEHAIVAPPTDRGVPARLERVLRRGLAVDPAARFGSLDELMAALVPRDRRGLAIGVAAGAVMLGVAGLALSAISDPGTPDPIAAAGPGCDAEAFAIERVWNQPVRDAYLARTDGRAEAAAEDVRWFDEIAARWRTSARDVCVQDRTGEPADPRRRACLAEALDALGQGILRTDRTHWPALRDPRACVGASAFETPRLRDVRTRLDGQQAVLSPDGTQIALASPNGERISFGADDGAIPTRSLPLAWLFHWRDGGIVGLDESGQVVQVDDGTPVARPLPLTGTALGVSPDLSIVARQQGDALVFVDDRGVERARLVGNFNGTLAWEPGNRRVATWVASDLWKVRLIDLVTGDVHTVPLRLHARGIGILSMAWRAPGRLLVSGAASDDFAEGIWELELDDSGALAGPPINLLAGQDNTAFYLNDIRARRVLATATSIALEIYARHEGVSEPIRRGREGWVSAADVTTGHVLLRTHRGSVVIDRDGKVIAETADVTAGFRHGALATVRERAGAIEVVVSAGGGGERVLASAPGSLGITGTVKCNAWQPDGCAVLTSAADGTTALYPLTADGLGGARPIPTPRSVDISADGKRVILSFNDETLGVHDVAAGTTTELHRDPGCHVQYVKWRRNGRDLLYSGVCPDGFVLRLRHASGKVETVLTSEGWISGLALLGDDDLRYSTREYARRLVLIDGLPIAD